MQGKFGESSRGNDPEELTKAWLNMSNDAFYQKYGFNWVPPADMQARVQNEMLKGVDYGIK